MSTSLFYTANLDKGSLDELQSLEAEMGVTLIAFDSNPGAEPSSLSDDQLQRLQAFEAKSGKVILAFK